MKVLSNGWLCLLAVAHVILVLDRDDSPVLIIDCTPPCTALVVLQMVYFTAVIITSNALAILTIQFPQNFKEAKYVAFSTFALTRIWTLVFIPSIVHCHSKQQYPKSSNLFCRSADCIGCSVMFVWSKSFNNDSLAKAKCSRVPYCNKFHHTS